MKKKILSIVTTFMMICSFVGLMPAMNVVAASGADAIVAVALAEEGYTEGANNDNKYGAALGQNNVAWCALFISWCARQAGIPESVIKTNAWAGDMGSSQRTGNFGGPYYPNGSITPQKGDIVYYDGEDINGSSGHVEIVISYNSSNNTINSIGGNTGGGNKVYIHKNQSLSARGTVMTIIGFERPNYSGEYTPPSNDDELGIPYPRPTGNPLLKNGSTGSGVSWLQTALNKANNAGLSVDGQFGSATQTAVTNFQRANGLEADGIAGPATINKLVEVLKGNNVSLAIQIWLSDSKMGSETTSFETYNWYYLCYKIYDKNSSKLLSEVLSNYKNYSITEVVYNPDGSIFHSYTYDNSDNNWIGFKPSNAGTYKYKIILKIDDKEGSSEKEFVISDHAHSYGSWTTTKSPTCTSDGTKTRTCSVCGSVETETISRTGHNYESTVIEPTCTEKGYTLHTCSVCGNSYKDTYVDEKGHYYIHTYVDNRYMHTCNKCGDTYYEDSEAKFNITFSCDKITACAGDTVKVNVYADTYGKKFSSFMMAYDYDKTNLEIVEITSEQLASPNFALAKDAFAYMSNPGGFTPDSTIPFLTFTFKINDNATANKYDVKFLGYKTINSQIPIHVNEDGESVSYLFDPIILEDAITVECSHQYTSKVIEPTCTEKGYTLRTCSICGYSYKSNYIDENGHYFGDSSITKSATCTSDGEKTRICSVCGETEKVIIPAVGHQYDSTIIAPSYSEDGYTLHICSYCGDCYKDNYTQKEKGDLNNDNSIEVSDIVKLQQYLSKLTTFEEEQFIAADMNNDGIVNVFDVIILKRKIINEFL